MYTDEQKRRHIYDLQRFLRRVQLAQGAPAPLAPDGIFGPETAQAVREFQRQNGLPATGTADEATWVLLYAQYAALTAADALPAPVSFFPAGADAHLSPGDKGQSVLALQLLLNTAVPHFPDLAAVPLSGIYDDATARAVRRLQAHFGLAQTGVTDRATWQALAALHNAYFGVIPLQWTVAGTAAL